MTSHLPGGEPESVVKTRTSARGAEPCHERQTKMTISDRTVAIVGTGNIGSRLAANFAAGGQDFLLAGRDPEDARKTPLDSPGPAAVGREARLTRPH